MDSPFNYSISSFTVTNTNDNDRYEEEDNNFEYESDFVYQEDDASEMSFTTDIDTSVIDSDYEDHELGLSGEGDSVVHNAYENDDSSNSLQSDSEELEENAMKHKSKKIKSDEEVDQLSINDSVDPSQKCPICLGAWTSSGDHRLCALRCGHLFGYSCIKQWLFSDNESAKKCPQCNTKASVRHIRFIYASRVTGVDTSEIERMKKKLREIRIRELKIRKALKKQKERTRKYKRLCEISTRALVTDSDLCFSD